jgi:hypothetical protein
MSKKNRNRSRNYAPKPVTSPAAAPAPVAHPEPLAVPELSPISPVQLAANRANALLSSGPRTQAGLARSSKNAVKSGLTGRTVLLPTDDVEEYASFLAAFQRDLKPVGQFECELVQIIVDCYWRLRRIQELEYALYAHGERQFAEAFGDEPQEVRRSMVLLQTHLTYQKELRNLQLQEARIERKRAKALAELNALQSERDSVEAPEDTSDAAPFRSEAEFFAALDAGYNPPRLSSQLAEKPPVEQNGFEFSNAPNGN